LSITTWSCAVMVSLSTQHHQRWLISSACDAPLADLYSIRQGQVHVGNTFGSGAVYSFVTSISQLHVFWTDFQDLEVDMPEVR
jgi:hypothetical protein